MTDVLVDAGDLPERYRLAVKRLRDPSKLMDKLVGRALEAFDENFRVAGRPRPWRRLSKVTIARRRKGKGPGAGAGPQILRDSGTLYRSVTRKGRTEGAIRRRHGRMALVGTSLSYAAAHQEGLPRRKGYVPPHTRRAHKRKTKTGKTVSVRAHGVKGHVTTLPAVPKRPFLVIPARPDQKEMELLALDHVMGPLL